MKHSHSNLLLTLVMTCLFVQVSTPILGLISLTAWGLRWTLKSTFNSF